MVSKLLKGRKKYKWRGLTEEQEKEMEHMLIDLDSSPNKDLTSAPNFNSTQNINHNTSNDITPNNEFEKSSFNDSCKGVEEMQSLTNKNNIDEIDENICPNKTSPSMAVRSDSSQNHFEMTLVSPFNAASLPSQKALLFEDFNLSSAGRTKETKQQKSSEEKVKRRSNSFNPIGGKQDANHQDRLIEDSIDYVLEQASKLPSIDFSDLSYTDNKNESKTSMNASNVALIGSKKDFYDSPDGYDKMPLPSEPNCSFLVEEDKNCDELSARISGCTSPFQQSGTSFLDDSDILRQVKEADCLLGGFDNSICNETCSIPSNLKQGNISKNGIKFRSVRRSSRLFRGNQKMEKNCSEELVSCRTNEKRHNFNGVRGSIYTDVEVVEKKFRRGSRRIIPLEPFSRNDQNVSTKLKQETFE